MSITPRNLTIEVLLNRNIKIYKPATTRVDEWTRAETGIGATIDLGIGNQILKGNWAVFKIKAKVNQIEYHL